MGMDFFQQTKTENTPKQYSGLQSLTDLLSQYMKTGVGAPQTPVPEMPYSQAGVQGAQSSVNRNLPQIQDFLSQLLQTGGIDQGLIGQYLKQTEQGGQLARQNIGAQVSASMPLGSTAAVSALTGGLGNQMATQNQNILQFLLQKAQQGVQNRTVAEQGMQALPDYIGSPGAMERSMIATRTPYDTANLTSKNSYFNTLMQGALGSYYTPEMTIDPSMWQQMVGPLLTALMKLIPGAGTAAAIT